MYAVPLKDERDIPAAASVCVRRTLNPIRPVIAHEAIHYIDFPDYEALERKFDQFSASVGKNYLENNNITKPRYMSEIPALIAAKGMSARIPDYIAASQEFKRFAMKTYLERLRLAGNLCGYEMLQFADCLKYENRNGIVDCFDDDKFIDAEWFRRFNSDTVLLADIPEECAQTGKPLELSIHLSHFGCGELITGNLNLYLNDGESRELVFSGERFSAGHGVHKLTGVKLVFKDSDTAKAYELEAEFTTENTISNSWRLWNYPQTRFQHMPELKIANPHLREFLENAALQSPKNSNILFTDTIDNNIWAPLEAGKTVILSYHRDNHDNTYYWPGAMDRFKPCIWDRGSNLGGIVHATWLREALAMPRYFQENLYPLIEEGYKINLDHFPVKVSEAVSGVDKPCRDRMNGLIKGIKDFQPDEVLRNFCYLFSVKIGAGTLIVSTFTLKRLDNPAVKAYLSALINNAPFMTPDTGLTIPELKDYLSQSTEQGVISETVMNHFWEIDNKPVEDTLFWEQAGVDLSKMGH